MKHKNINFSGVPLKEINELHNKDIWKKKNKLQELERKRMAEYEEM